MRWGDTKTRDTVIRLEVLMKGMQEEFKRHIDYEEGQLKEIRSEIKLCPEESHIKVQNGKADRIIASLSALRKTVEGYETRRGYKAEMIRLIPVVTAIIATGIAVIKIYK